MRPIFFSALLSLVVGTPVSRGETLPPWTPGTLDIHQIATGRGNSTLIIGPDGTSIMIDAGATNTALLASSPPRPDGSRRPGEWIGRYALRQLRPTGRAELDYFVVTHFHADHIGDVGANTPVSPAGSYLLTGVSDVAALVPIGTLIDRGYPDYGYPAPPQAGATSNYLAFVQWRQSQGAAGEQLHPGRADQIVLRHDAAAYRTFAVRNLAANAYVWAGTGDAAQTAIPLPQKSATAAHSDENMCSIALRLSYGKFDYFTGGDMACDTFEGTEPWRDVETPVARAAGPVEVAVANHHGYFDAVGSGAVRALQPLVWVVPAWHVTHPGIAQLERMLSERVYPGPRNVFITNLTPAAALLNERFLPRVSSTEGHIVVRVAPGGESFQVFVTDDADESDTIKKVFGPYQCR